MDMIATERKRGTTELAGARILAMMHPSQSELSRYFQQLVKSGKERWNWHVDVMCWRDDEAAFEDIVEPRGEIFPHPNLLDQAGWESDPDRVSAIDSMLWEAEQKARFPIGRLVAAAPASIGRAYVTAARKRHSSKLSKKVLADNSEPFRIVRRLFAHAAEMLEKSKPDLVIATEWNTPAQCTVRLAAAGFDIPCLTLRRSKIHSGYDYWTPDMLMLNRAAMASALLRRQSDAPASEKAKAYIRKFRETPQMSAYVEEKWRQTGRIWQGAARRWAMLPLRFARGLATDTLYLVRGLDRTQRAPLFERLVEPEIRNFTAWRHRHFLNRYSADELAKLAYVYFPMHKETDMPLSFQATPWQDQLNTVRVIASALPSRYKLLVREHKLNYGQRPTQYFELLSSLPNVTIIDPFVEQFDYIRNADLIITENGSSGWEGLLLRKRILTICENFYGGSGLGVSVRDLNSIDKEIVAALSRPAVEDPGRHDAALCNLIDAEMATVFPRDEGSLELALNKLEECFSEFETPEPAPV